MRKRTLGWLIVGAIVLAAYAVFAVAVGPWKAAAGFTGVIGVASLGTYGIVLIAEDS